MKKGCVKSTDLVCLECGNVFTIMRKTGKLKEYSHIKDLWCYRCLDVTKHFEIYNKEKFLVKDIDDEIDLYIKDLIIYGKVEDI